MKRLGFTILYAVHVAILAIWLCDQFSDTQPAHNILQARPVMRFDIQVCIIECSRFGVSWAAIEQHAYQWQFTCVCDGGFEAAAFYNEKDRAKFEQHLYNNEHRKRQKEDLR